MGDKLLSTIIFILVFGFAIFLSFRVVPYFFFFLNKERVQATVKETSNQEIEYYFINNDRKIEFRRKISATSSLNELKVGDKFYVFYSPDIERSYIELEDSFFDIFLYLVGLIICYLGVIIFFLAMTGKYDINKILGKS